MGESFKISLTALTTTIGGITVMVVGQIFIRFCIEPIQKLVATIGEVADSLILAADLLKTAEPVRPLNDIFNSSTDTYRKTERLEASATFRQKAHLLMRRAAVVPFYDIFAKWGILPTMEELQRAHRGLIRLSKGVITEDPVVNEASRKSVSNALRLELE